MPIARNRIFRILVSRLKLNISDTMLCNFLVLLFSKNLVEHIFLGGTSTLNRIAAVIPKYFYQFRRFFLVLLVYYFISICIIGLKSKVSDYNWRNSKSMCLH